MQFWENDTTIAFTSCHSIYFFHFGYYIHLTNSSRSIFYPMFFGYIAQST